jgi:hypothetical protein
MTRSCPPAPAKPHRLCGAQPADVPMCVGQAGACRAAQSCLYVHAHCAHVVGCLTRRVSRQLVAIHGMCQKRSGGRSMLLAAGSQLHGVLGVQKAGRLAAGGALQ